MKRAAIFGSLVDLKNVNAHKSIRLTIDIPAEQAAEVVAIFGWPTMAAPVPVALARMVGNLERKAPPPSLAQQAGALCASPIFQAFAGVAGEEDCAVWVREVCDVKSRSEIRAGTEAGDRWLDLLGKFHGWEAAEQAGVEQ
jgi:hypothetical protein